jgi:hypothetical protein
MSASCDKPHHKGLPPLRHLVEHLHWGCTDQAQQIWLLDAVLSEYAHELAEKQRQSDVGDCCEECAAAVELAARLIDPEVSDG